jgi:hypothetical protein
MNPKPKTCRTLTQALAAALSCALLTTAGPTIAAPDLGKRACAQEARRLCPAEMRSFSRKRVEACMITKIDQTSSICHAAMLRIKVEREAVQKVQPSVATGKL